MTNQSNPNGGDIAGDMSPDMSQRLSATHTPTPRGVGVSPTLSVSCRKANRREEWWARRKWHTRRNGNVFLHVRGFNIMVYCVRGRWTFRIETAGHYAMPAHQWFATQGEAQAASLEGFLYAKKHSVRIRDASETAVHQTTAIARSEVYLPSPAQQREHTRGNFVLEIMAAHVLKSRERDCQ
jgi:hypothetical protein